EDEQDVEHLGPVGPEGEAQDQVEQEDEGEQTRDAHRGVAEDLLGLHGGVAPDCSRRRGPDRLYHMVAAGSRQRIGIERPRTSFAFGRRTKSTPSRASAWIASTSTDSGRLIWRANGPQHRSSVCEGWLPAGSGAFCPFRVITGPATLRSIESGSTP